MRRVGSIGILFVVLMISPVAAALAPVPAIAPLPTATDEGGEQDDALPQPQVHFYHPLLNADPLAWMPVLALTGEMDEAAEAAAAASVTSCSMSVYS